MNPRSSPDWTTGGRPAEGERDGDRESNGEIQRVRRSASPEGIMCIFLSLCLRVRGWRERERGGINSSSRKMIPVGNG